MLITVEVDRMFDFTFDMRAEERLLALKQFGVADRTPKFTDICGVRTMGTSLS